MAANFTALSIEDVDGSLDAEPFVRADMEKKLEAFLAEVSYQGGLPKRQKSPSGSASGFPASEQTLVDAMLIAFNGAAIQRQALDLLRRDKYLMPMMMKKHAQGDDNAKALRKIWAEEKDDLVARFFRDTSNADWVTELVKQLKPELQLLSRAEDWRAVVVKSGCILVAYRCPAGATDQVIEQLRTQPQVAQQYGIMSVLPVIDGVAGTCTHLSEAPSLHEVLFGGDCRVILPAFCAGPDAPVGASAWSSGSDLLDFKHAVHKMALGPKSTSTTVTTKSQCEDTFHQVVLAEKIQEVEPSALEPEPEPEDQDAEADDHSLLAFKDQVGASVVPSTANVFSFDDPMERQLAYASQKEDALKVTASGHSKRSKGWRISIPKSERKAMHKKFRNRGDLKRFVQEGETRCGFELDGRIYITDQFQHYGIDLFEAANFDEADVWRVIVSKEKRFERGEKNLRRISEKGHLRRISEKGKAADGQPRPSDELLAFKDSNGHASGADGSDSDMQSSTLSVSTCSKPGSSVSDPSSERNNAVERSRPLCTLPPHENPRYRTELCLEFLEGRCSRPHCSFAHGKHELQSEHSHDRAANPGSCCAEHCCTQTKSERQVLSGSADCSYSV